ncbi:MAG: hypothetical protein ACJA1A_003674 [Saprospiraceae bacterium]|jgi:hypothetical protein
MRESIKIALAIKRNRVFYKEKAAGKESRPWMMISSLSKAVVWVLGKSTKKLLKLTYNLIKSY